MIPATHSPAAATIVADEETQEWSRNLATDNPCGIDKPGAAIRRLYDIVRQYVPCLDHDEPLTDHIEKIASLFASGALPQEVDACNW